MAKQKAHKASTRRLGDQKRLKRRPAKSKPTVTVTDADLSHRPPEEWDKIGQAVHVEPSIITVELLKPTPEGWRVRIDGKTHEPDLLVVALDRIQRAILERCT